MENNKIDFAKRLKKIADDFLGFASGNISEKCGEYTGRVKETVYSLLDFDKPKVMVYGIYNSGKSTLINALMKKEVAEMADRPMTCKIAEYDHGDYILVDSPGVDAPIEHENITKKFLSKCHIILFVISSKGGFESKYNYERMVELINGDIPFVIVLNERGYPKKKEWDQKTRDLYEAKYQQELKSIQYKIIDNLKKVSGDKNIADKYEVYILNARKALLGIQKNKQQMYAASHIEDLDRRIVQLIQSSSALKVLRQPLTNLKSCMDDAEKYITNEMHDNDSDYEDKINILRQKQENLKDEMRILIRQETSSKVEELAQMYIKGTAEAAQGVEYDVIGVINAKYNMKLKDLNLYIRRSLDGGENFCTPEDEDSLLVTPKEKDYESRNIEIEEDNEPVTREPEEKKIAFLEFFKTQKMKDKEKRERLEMEAYLTNTRNENLMNEMIRGRQEARQTASGDMFELQNLLISAADEDITLRFEDIMNWLHEIDCQNKERIAEGKRQLKELEDIRRELSVLENTIA